MHEVCNFVTIFSMISHFIYSVLFQMMARQFDCQIYDESELWGIFYVNYE